MFAKSVSVKAFFVLAAIIAALAASLLCVAQPAWADGVQYLYRSWDATNKTVVTETRTADCVNYDSSMTNLHQGWWYVNGEHVVDKRVNVSGEVNIIIQDGSTLLLGDGIHVPAGSTLNIYNTPGGENGVFCALADTNYVAAIGGNDGEAGGIVNIHSGKVTANAYNDNKGEDGAGIGGGNKGSGGTVIIYGGTVSATGANYGAGIGSGDADADNIHGGFVRIYGGDVTATGGTDAAGIGGGEGADGANVEIWGGKVTAQGGSTNEDGGAGIGSGDDDGRADSGGTTKIYGGEVTATGGADGAGIGGGDGCSGGDITIAGGTITAAGGTNGAGIGGGDDGAGGTIDITGGTITATSVSDGAGIGGGDSGAGGNITIAGGSVEATGGANGAGIGGGDCGDGGTITITGGDKIKATGGANGAGIGGGNDAVWTKIEITGGNVEAQGGDYAAGIGSGDRDSLTDGGEIIISGGTVMATGGSDGAGIGGGEDCTGGNITISGGTVTATGGTNTDASPDSGGAGIGGGDGADGGTINITGAQKVIASGATRAAGIGGGDGADGGTINISGGQQIKATGGLGGAGIGGGDGGDGGNITIKDHSKVNAFGGIGAAGIGGGDGGDGGTIELSANYVTARGYWYGAGIGGGDGGDGGSITINGGNTYAHTASETEYGAGIGGGRGGDGGTITINGGNVSAEGGSRAVETEDDFSDNDWDYYGGAGIGGGGKGGDSGTITINGGTIWATAGYNAAGIGGGDHGKCETVTITGGAIEATGGSGGEHANESGGAGIGSGFEGSVGKITISGGDKVTAKAGTMAAGIGGGSESDGGEITISGGNIEANGGTFERRIGTADINGGAGIGGGYDGDGGTITISNGNVTAKAGKCAAGIGGGTKGTSGTIKITGGVIDASTDLSGAGIGSGAICEDKSNAVDITIDGGTITAKAGDEQHISWNDGAHLWAFGAAIGAGGTHYKDEAIVNNSYFSGSIKLNGGRVNAMGTNGWSNAPLIGAAQEDGLKDCEGTVEFNGATVYMKHHYNSHNGKYNVPVQASAGKVTLKEDNTIHQSVRYYDGSEKIALKDERINTLVTKTGDEWTIVEPCAHKDSAMVDNEDGSTHKVSDCPYCNIDSSSEPHVYGEPTSWAWTDDNTKATATFKCACGHEKTVDATVELKEGDNTKYVATAILDGKTYTAEADRLIYDITVVDSEHGSIEVNSTARVGAEVGLDVLPDEHYHLKSVAGDGVTLNHVEGNHYTFTMPKGNVTLRAEFANKVAVESVSLNKEEITLEKESKETLTATVMPEDTDSTVVDRTVTWKSSDESVATVDETGKVTAVAPGTATITVTATNGTADTADDKTDTCVVTVPKLEVEVPTIASKVYNGKSQAADIEASDLYDVTSNEGGTNAGEYDVALTLKDPDTYKWSDSDASSKILTFEITKAQNRAIVSLEGWACNEQANDPVVEADYGADTATFEYKAKDDADEAYSSEKPTEPGDYTVRATIAESDNYLAASATADFTISGPVMVTLTLVGSSIDGEDAFEPYEVSIPKGSSVEALDEDAYDDIVTYFTKGVYAPYDDDVYVTSQPLSNFDKWVDVEDEDDVYYSKALSENTTLYVALAKAITSIELSVKVPVCGTDMATSKPAVTMAEGSLVKVSPRGPIWYDAETIEEIESGTIAGGATYGVEVEFVVDKFGYFLTGSTDYEISVAGADAGSVDTLPYGAIFTVTAEHDWDEGKVTTDPTCEKPGVKTYTCKVEGCGATRTEDIDATGHEWGAWTKLDDKQHQHVCKHDKTHVEKANHTWDKGKVTKKATETQTGVKTYTCTVCKATKTEVIPKVVPAPVALKSATAKDQTFAGKALKPKVTVKDAKGKTVPASAYTVTYANNAKVGTATATVKAKDGSGYKGTVKATFAIKLGKTKVKTVAHVKAKTADVSWAKVPGATIYQLQWREGSGAWKTKAVKATKTTLKGLKLGKTYDFRVRAVAGKTKGAWSPVAKRWFTPATNVKATADKSGAIKVSWNATSGANAGYQVVVRYSKTGAVVKRLAVPAGKTVVTIKGLKAGKTAWVQVRPMRNTGYVGVLTNAKAPVKVPGGSTSTKSPALQI